MSTFSTVVDRLVSIMNLAIPILMGIALFIIVWGLAMSVLNSESEEAVSKGKSMAIKGAIGLFVITAVWGLVYIVVNAFFSQNEIKSSDDILDPVMIDLNFNK